MNVVYIINCKSIIICTKIINISSKPCFFLNGQSLEIFSKHNGFATILESFALNFIISEPLTNK